MVVVGVLGLVVVGVLVRLVGVVGLLGHGHRLPSFLVCLPPQRFHLLQEGASVDGSFAVGCCSGAAWNVCSGVPIDWPHHWEHNPKSNKQSN